VKAHRFGMEVVKVDYVMLCFDGLCCLTLGR
jgi:hypothetical protein